MSFKFLPLPLYIVFCLFLCGLMIFFAITRRKKDRPGLITVYITLSFLAPFMILGRTIQTYFSNYLKYYDYSAIIVFAIILVMFVEFTIMAINDFRKSKLKKQVIIGLFIGWFILIFYLLIMFKII